MVKTVPEFIKIKHYVVSALLTLCLSVSTAQAQDADEEKEEGIKNFIPGLLFDPGERSNIEDIDESNPFPASQYDNLIVDEDILYQYYADGEYGRAIYGLLRLARDDNAKAAETIGLMYRYGQGVPQDNAQAIKWFNTAAEEHRPLSQHHIGVMYFSGHGVGKNMMQASMWLRLAVMNYNDGPDKERAKQDLQNVSLRMSDSELQHSKDLIKRFIHQNPLPEDHSKDQDDAEAETEGKAPSASMPETKDIPAVQP
ncbi:MAG: tetratricopeptide repeat protein [Pseudomonadota bacterium]